MLLTTSTLVFFLLASIAALGIGIFSKRNEVYVLGIVLLLFMGLWVFQEGISQPVGSVVTENGTTTNIVNTYETSATTWTNGFSLLMIVTAAGLFLHLYKSGKEEKRRKADSIEVEE